MAADTTPVPTDAEIDAAWSECDFGPESQVHRHFARAVLARWGAQPAPAASPALTPEQCNDLLAASFCIAAVGDPCATIKPEDAERIITLLHELGGIKEQ